MNGGFRGRVVDGEMRRRVGMHGGRVRRSSPAATSERAVPRRTWMKRREVEEREERG
jgi:hypothetical protein